MLRFPYARTTLRRPAPTLAGAAARHRPFLLVGVTGPAGAVGRQFRLDSGADDTILPQSFASALGLDLTNAPLAEAESASGAVVQYPCSLVKLRISDGVEYCEWDAVIGFLNVSRQTGLAGLAGFLNYFDVELFGDGHEFTLTPNASFPGQHGTH